MRTINRVVALVRPKQPYYDWANQLDETGPRIDEMPAHMLCHAYLLPISDKPEAELKRCFAEIFDEELVAWHRVVADWPKKRTFAMFQDWFDVQFVELVFDASRKPIEHDE